jgi:hypothetical protein
LHTLPPPYWDVYCIAWQYAITWPGLGECFVQANSRYSTYHMVTTSHTLSVIILSPTVKDVTISYESGTSHVTNSSCRLTWQLVITMSHTTVTISHVVIDYSHTSQYQLMPWHETSGSNVFSEVLLLIYQA